MSETTAVNQNSKTPREDVCMVPPVDVIEDKAGITLHADLPGVPKDKLNLHVDAEFSNGVLKLRIPKAEHALPRRIEISVA